MDYQLFPHRHIISLEDFSRHEIEIVLQVADSFKEISNRTIKKVPTLRGRTIVNLFFEPSTRTRLSFEIAAKRMSADTFNISKNASSAEKGETLLDTAMNIQAMNPDVIVIRHPHSGAAHFLACHTAAAIINAGDGTHEHPSQGFLDLMTVLEKKGRIEGLKIAIIGDITHSRVAHSDIIGFSKMGAEVMVYGPGTLLPFGLERLGATVAKSLADAVKDADVVMTLRIQKERLHDPLLPSLREYATFYGINERVLEGAKPDAIVMHPGPINRGVELDPALADGKRSVVLDQVTNGVAVRMALLYLVMGGEKI